MQSQEKGGDQRQEIQAQVLSPSRSPSQRSKHVGRERSTGCRWKCADERDQKGRPEPEHASVEIPCFLFTKKKKIEWSQLKHNKLIYANRQCPKNSGPVIQPQCGQRVRSHGTHTAAWQKGTFLCSRGQWIWVGQTLDTHASPSMKVLVGEDEAGEFYCDASGDA